MQLHKHEEGCDEVYWSDRDSEILITPLQLSRKRAGEGCRACGFWIEIFRSIKEQCGSADFGDIALSGMGVEAFAEKVESYYDDITAEMFEYVEAVHTARELWSANKDFQSRKKAEDRSKQSSSKPSRPSRPVRSRRR